MKSLSVGSLLLSPGLRVFVVVTSSDNTQRAFPPAGYNSWFYSGARGGCYVEIFDMIITGSESMTITFSLLNDSITYIETFYKALE